MRSGSALVYALAGLAGAGAVVAAMALLVPSVPPLAILGGDGVAYDAMARHPLEAVAAFPAAARLGVPLLVAALPLSVAHGFLVVGLVSLLLAGSVVALICREAGLPLAHATAGAALAAGSYVGVLTAYNRYYVDAPLLLCVALALLLALRGAWGLFLCAALAAVFVKEIGVTLIVLPFLIDRRAVRRAVLLAVPVIVAFALLQTLGPHIQAVEHTGRGTGLRPDHIFQRGFILSTLNPLVALFGGILLAWPLGFPRSPAALRRAHIWLLVAGPVLIFGSWERTLGPFLPFVVPAALFALRDASRTRVGVFTAGSLAATAVAGSLTIGDGATTVAHKLLLVLPGLAVAAAAVAPGYVALSRSRGRAAASTGP